jgi:hypothetical protein
LNTGLENPVFDWFSDNPGLGVPITNELSQEIKVRFIYEAPLVQNMTLNKPDGNHVVTPLTQPDSSVGAEGFQRIAFDAHAMWNQPQEIKLHFDEPDPHLQSFPASCLDFIISGQG